MVHCSGGAFDNFFILLKMKMKMLIRHSVLSTLKSLCIADGPLEFLTFLSALSIYPTRKTVGKRLTLLSKPCVTLASAESTRIVPNSPRPEVVSANASAKKKDVYHRHSP